MSRTGRTRRLARVLVLVVALADVTAGQVAPVGPGTTAPAGAGATPSRPEIAGRRIVKDFDFDERRFGNFDPVPMHWRRHGGVGFARYLEGEFDASVGHGAAPSFRLDLDGGSLGYHYEGRDISVRTNSDYLIVAWVKTRSLEIARAYFTAYYLDRKGNRISGTERRSKLVGGGGGETDFAPLSVGLAGNVAEARYVGISLWLTQSGVWHTGPRPMRAIEREDVTATAWFDDVTVYRLPRVTLHSAQPGHVFAEGETIRLQTETPGEAVRLVTGVSDPDGLNLSAKLVIRSADGRQVHERVVPIQSAKKAAPATTTYADLPVGVYTAELIVSTGETVLVRRSLRFARLAPPVSPPVERGRGFGVILSDTRAALLPGQRQLLQELRTEYVKVPVWHAREAATGEVDSRESIDRYLEAIVESRADPIGILTDTPSSQEDGKAAGVRGMLDILNESSLGWKPLIAGVWSRYAGLIYVWQVGKDGDPSVFLDHRLGGVVPILRQEMRPLMSEPLLATTMSAGYAAPSPRMSDYVSVTVPAAVPPGDIGGHVQPFLGEDPAHVWAVVEPLPEEPYPRRARLADLGRRLVETYYQGVGGVFMAGPWDTRADLLSAQVDPREDFLVFRTVSDVLGGTTPVSRTTIEGQAKCLVFDRNGRGILFVWDDYAPPEGREHILLLREEAEQIDLWGRRSRLASIGTRQVVRIGPMPTFIVNTPTWIIEFRRRFVVDPPILEASFDAFERDVVFTNTYHEPISGLLRLIAPADWDVRPNRIPFVLEAGEQARHSISVRFPRNAEAGVTPLVGEFTLDADRRYRIVAPAWFELGLENIDMDTYVYRAGSRAVVRVSMTNRTGGPVSFQGYLVVPGRQRIKRTFAAFHPGASLTKDFVLEDAAGLAGRRIRVGLKEIQGPRLWNRVVAIP